MDLHMLSRRGKSKRVSTWLFTLTETETKTHNFTLLSDAEIQRLVNKAFPEDNDKLIKVESICKTTLTLRFHAPLIKSELVKKLVPRLEAEIVHSP